LPLPKINSFEEYNLDNGLLFLPWSFCSRCNFGDVSCRIQRWKSQKTGFAHFSNIYYLKELKT
jgi:hypothetical protein